MRGLLTVVAATGALALVAASAWSAPRFVGNRFPIRRPAVVAGLDGDRALILDRGRALGHAPLDRRGSRMGRARAVHGDRAREPLTAIETLRLDARIVFARRDLSERDKIVRLARVVAARVVHDEQVPAGDGTPDALRLSQVAASGRGGCRERVFLLATLLAEVGVPARVRYGVAYVGEGADGSPHAYLDIATPSARVGRPPHPAAGRSILDVDRPDPLVRLRPVVLQVVVDGAAPARVGGARTRGGFYEHTMRPPLERR